MSDISWKWIMKKVYFSSYTNKYLKLFSHPKLGLEPKLMAS